MNTELEIFQKLCRESSRDNGIVMFDIRLEMPPSLSYTISSSFNEENNNSYSHNKKKTSLSETFDEYFNYELDGMVQSPKEFDRYKCKIFIGNLDSEDDVKNFHEGYIGYGCLLGDQLDFHIHVTPEILRNIIQVHIFNRHTNDSYIKDSEYSLPIMIAVESYKGKVNNQHMKFSFMVVRLLS